MLKYGNIRTDKIKKMSQGFDQQIFGDLVQPQPSNFAKTSIKGQQLLTTAQTISSQHSTKTSFKGQKYKKQHNVKFYPISQSSTCAQIKQQRFSESSYGDPYMKRGDIEKCKMGLSSILKQVKVKKVGKDDIFYCSCNEQQQKNMNCMACGGKGGIDGNNNMIKFIEYVMEFKLGIKQSYDSYNNIKNNNKNNKLIQSKDQYLYKTQKNTKQSTSILNPTSNKIINLTKSKQIDSSKQNNRINQFCSDFIKEKELHKSSNSNIGYGGKNKKNEYEEYNQYSQYQKYEQQDKQHDQKKPKIRRIDSGDIKNQSYVNVSAIKLGLNSMSESVVDYDRQKIQKNNNDEKQDEDYEIEMRDNVSNNTLENSSEYKDQYYGYGYAHMSNIEKTNTKQANPIIGGDRKSLNYNSKNDNLDQQQQRMPVNTQSMIVGLNRKKPVDNRKSLPCKSFMNFHQFNQKLSQQNTIHNGYGCDICAVTPIEGTRYHCTSLMCNNDYDLCEKCYEEKGHQHKMQPIKYTNLKQICEGLEHISQKSIKSKAKQCGIRMSMGAASSIQSAMNNVKSSLSGYYNQYNIRNSLGAGGQTGISNMENSCRMDEQFQDYSKPVFKSSIR